MNAVVRAIDVGYGNVKYVTGQSNDGVIQCGHFPSIATPSVRKQIGAVMAQQLDVMTVEADGKLFDVGPDAHLNSIRRGLRRTGENYVETSHYLALFRGALSKINDEVIDHMMVGLPVKYMSAKKRIVAERLTGKHPVAGGRIVDVKRVTVMEQPFGAFADYSMSASRFMEMKDLTNLIIDMGYYTLDWLVATGMKMHTRQSDSCEIGMSALLQEISDAISQKLGVPSMDVRGIDIALRTGKFRDSGVEYAIEPYRTAAQPIIEAAIDDMMSSIGDPRSISYVIVSGGGADMIFPELRKRFTLDQLIKADDSMYSNVRGFYRIGAHQARVKQPARAISA